MRKAMSPRQCELFDLVKPWLLRDENGVMYVPPSAPEKVRLANEELDRISEQELEEKILEWLED